MSGGGSKKPLNSDGWLAALASSALGSGGGIRLRVNRFLLPPLRCVGTLRMAAGLQSCCCLCDKC